MRWLRWAGLVVLLVVLAGAGFAWSIGYFARDAVYSTGRGAIDGHDPVAYFTEGQAVAGREDITAEWNGAVWRFSNAAHRDRFLADPAAYAPAFGGYCAWAMGNAYTAHGDPQVFAVVDGRLFLNFDAATQAQWSADRDSLIAAADRNWPASRPGQASIAR